MNKLWFVNSSPYYSDMTVVIFSDNYSISRKIILSSAQPQTENMKEKNV